MIYIHHFQNIRIHFNDFDLDDSPGCQGDHLIFEIDPHVESQLKAVCGRNKPRDVIFHSNKLLITFFSDFIGSGRGFNISYEFTSDVDTCDVRNTYPCGNRKCVPRSVLCDGKDDCGDGTDESRKYCRRTVMQRERGRYLISFLIIEITCYLFIKLWGTRHQTKVIGKYFSSNCWWINCKARKLAVDG